MKCSVQFREEQCPLVRIKLPVNFFGLPFHSKCSLGGKDDLAVHLGTNFESGPTARFSYRPTNDASPAVLFLKAGLGFLGSPIGSSLSVSAELDVLNPKNTRVMLKAAPRVGDLGIRRFSGSQTVIYSEEHLRRLRNLGGGGEGRAEEGGTPGGRGSLARGSNANDATHLAAVEATNSGEIETIGGLGLLGGGGSRSRSSSNVISNVSNGVGVSDPARENAHGSNSCMASSSSRRNGPEALLDIGSGQEPVANGVASASLDSSGDRCRAAIGSDTCLSQAGVRDTVIDLGEGGGGGERGVGHGSSGRGSFSLGWKLRDGRRLLRRCREAGWGVSVNSVLPLGKFGLAQLRWQMLLPHDSFRSVYGNGGSEGGGSLVVKHPILSLDKISVEIREEGVSFAKDRLKSFSWGMEAGTNGSNRVGPNARSPFLLRDVSPSGPLKYSTIGLNDPLKEVVRLEEEIRGVREQSARLNRKVDELTAEMKGQDSKLGGPERSDGSKVPTGPAGVAAAAAAAGSVKKMEGGDEKKVDVGRKGGPGGKDEGCKRGRVNGDGVDKRGSGMVAKFDDAGGRGAGNAEGAGKRSEGASGRGAGRKGGQIAEAEKGKEQIDVSEELRRAILDATSKI